MAKLFSSCNKGAVMMSGTIDYNNYRLNSLREVRARNSTSNFGVPTPFMYIVHTALAIVTIAY